MQAGQFDTRVLFQKKTLTPNSGGGKDVTWPELGGAGKGSRWVALWPISPSKEDHRTETSGTTHQPDYRLILRTDSLTQQIAAGDRAQIDGHPWKVVSVGRPDRRRGTITLIVQEGKPT